jgi:two-component system OmpR family sensor kinase
MGLTFLLFSLASWLFYRSAKYHILENQRAALKYESQKIESTLRELHLSNSNRLLYPVSKIADSAIYDLNKEYIFGTYTYSPSLDMHDAEQISLVVKMEPYYLGAAYLMLSRPVDLSPIHLLQRNLLLFMLFAGLLFAVLGYYLGKLFIAPMRESMKQMNRFIQDTTHELNTPISTILTNIEMIETFGACQKSSEEFKRIEIASKTLSRIYEDLTYLNLNHHYHRQIEKFDIGKLMEERMVYFSAMAEAKRLKVMMNIQSGVLLEIDKNDAIRLIDNLISNAIKYNKPEGSLWVHITSESLVVKDSGIGIGKRDFQTIMQRFKRANSSEGGFGIGLDIVNQVVNSYRFTLEMKSVAYQGTEVKIKW